MKLDSRTSLWLIPLLLISLPLQGGPVSPVPAPKQIPVAPDQKLVEEMFKMPKEEDPAIQIWRDSEEVNVVEGQIRDFRLKKEVQVPRGKFFEKYGAGLGLGKDDQMKAYRSDTDRKGAIHTRHEQFHSGIPVIGTDYIVEEQDGVVQSAFGQIVSDLDLDTVPAITEGQALEYALSKVAGEVYPNNAYPWELAPEKFKKPPGELVIGSTENKMTPESCWLAYRFTLSGPSPGPSTQRDLTIYGVLGPHPKMLRPAFGEGPSGCIDKRHTLMA